MAYVGNMTLFKRLIEVFPPLHRNNTKGLNGRIAVVGGSFQFTGAPYYSAISALKVGGDLGHIFCSKFSSPAIKSYSPQLIAHPVFISEEEQKFTEEQQKIMLQNWTAKITGWQKAIHSWVIGPGLGRDTYMYNFFPKLIQALPNDCMVTIDADGLYYLCQHPYLFDQLRRFRTLVTPNLRQLAFLQRYFDIPKDEILKAYDPDQGVMQFQADWFHLPFRMIIKGKQDVILTRNRTFIVGIEGGNKRCGGMGDIVAGVASICGLWDFDYGLPLASSIVRIATKKAFDRQGRGLTAPAVISQLSQTVKQLEAIL